jgi:hypothetical protein
MGVEYSDNWAQYSNGHLTNQATATKVIKSAVAVLKSSTQMELVIWCLAAESASPGVIGNYLEVFKGDHQEGGSIFDKESHLTLAVWNKKKTIAERNSLYHGAFHLFFLAKDPAVGKTKYMLKPNKLSYKSLGNDIKTFDIAGAAEIEGDK